jgi:thiamine biosynthesis lipoprotein
MICFILGLVQLLSAGPAVQQDLTRFTFTEYHMGIDARIVVFATSQNQAETACEAAFKRIAGLEAIMSDYRQDSELMRLCREAHEKPVKVSRDLMLVLGRAERIAKQSNGAFDITVGPLVQLWRKARREQKLPTSAEISAAKSLVGWRKVKLDRKLNTVTLGLANMRLDLGGIAKGYAGDEAIKELRKHGIRSALVELGGDIVLSNAPPNTKGWTISVPNASAPGTPAMMYLANCGVSTSGDTEQFVVIDGVRYSHVVDPTTGMGLGQRVQATIIAKDGLTADPVSTALTILDVHGRTEMLKNYSRAPVFVRVALD